jgi:hypothetical protein
MKESAKYVKETLKFRDTIEGAFIALGERFNKIKEEALWNGMYGSYGEFLADMHVSEATASKLVQVYRVYIVEHKVNPKQLAKIGYSNLYAAIPLLEKYSVEEVIQKASLLRRDDISVEARDSKEDACKHENTETVKVRVCMDCGHREQA